MLDELYKAVGEDNILNELENHIRSGLYFNIPLDGNLNIEKDLLFIKDVKDVAIHDMKLAELFTIRRMYLDLISTNKCLVLKGKYNKFILSNQCNGIMFNTFTDSFRKRLKSDSLINIIKESIIDFCTRINRIEKINYYLKNIETIATVVEEYIDKYNNIKVIICLDVPLQEYMNECDKYFEEKLLDGKSVLIDNIKFGQCTLFASSSSDKPYLYTRSNIYNNKIAYKCSIEQAKQLLKLREWLKFNLKGNIKYKNGIIKYRCELDKSDVNILEYEYYPTDVFDIFEEKNLYIDDYKIDSAKKFNTQFYNLIKDNKSRNVEKFKKAYEQYYGTVNSLSITKFKAFYKPIMNNLYSIISTEFKDSNLMRNFILLEISTSDYFFKTNIVKELKSMREIIENKLKTLKNIDEYVIESENEYWYVLGSTISYIVSLSKSEGNHLRFKLNYSNINKPEQVLNKLSLDFSRYGYNASNRSVKLYSAILNYKCKSNKINKMIYRQGLFEYNNIMYTKSENKINNKGEM